MNAGVVKLIRIAGLLIAAVGMVMLLWVPSQPWVRIRVNEPLLGSTIEVWFSGSEMLQVADGLAGMGSAANRIAQQTLNLGIADVSLFDLLLLTSESDTRSRIDDAIALGTSLAPLVTVVRLGILLLPLAGLLLIVLILGTPPVARQRGKAATLFLISLFASLFMLGVMTIIGNYVSKLATPDTIVQINGSSGLVFAFLAAFMAVGGSALHLVSRGIITLQREPVMAWQPAIQTPIAPMMDAYMPPNMTAIPGTPAVEKLPDEAWAPKRNITPPTPSAKPTPDTKTCWKCHQEITASALYCRHCGTRQGIATD